MLLQERTSVAAHHRWRWVALAALLVAEAMNLLDATIVTVAAPVIHADLGGAESDIQWFAAAYTLPFAVLLVNGGRLGDRLGRRRVFAVGVAGFALASVVCGLSATADMLTVARAVQGAASALVIPQTIGLIRAMFDGPDLARAMGSIGPVMGLAAICGPVLGAVLTHADLFGSSWRAAFLVNVPLAVVVLALVPFLREDRAVRPPRADLPGTALVVLGTGLVVYPLIQGDTLGWPLWTWAALLAGLGVLVGFGLHQRRRARRGHDPLVEPSLFRDRGFPAALTTSTLFFAATTGLSVVIVTQVQLGMGSDVLVAGMTLLPWSCGMALASWVAGTRLVPRHGAKVMFAGLVALLVGLVSAIAVYGMSDPVAIRWPLVAALAVSGVGNGLFTVPFFTTALSRVRPHETGSAAGLLNAVQQFGGTLGVAVLGSAFFHTFATGTRANAAPVTASLDAIQLAFWLAVAMIAAVVVTASLMLAPARTTEHQTS
ncbi:MFS transporter [Streptoalloteichus hindustanus]|uniref:Major Facilitator Superfamily protein n=1 Tax=Streptoalloteichus hindustanus TaxID=2017 RepID=A0A1M5N144_STRHI|nr:MFS transporter [Streptoalloteichus hindustanus]SHG82703.1 Major Facilitator Superfamily protein [Streptoalloteichus hindustanus]